MADLFDTNPGDESPKDAAPQRKPLADALRPAALSEVVGQAHILGPEGKIGRAHV